MRKIFLAYPIKGRMPMFQVGNIVDISRTRFKDCVISIRFLEGSPINLARAELVQEARNAKMDEIVMVDCDIDMKPQDLGRLISHDEDVVCAIYCHRSLGTKFHLQPTSPPTPPREDGLLRVKQSAIGASKIKLSVFDKLQRDNPDRLGLLTDRGGGHKHVWEFFPFELQGANTPASRLQDILKLVDNFDLTKPASDLAEKITSLANTQYLTENYHISEDYAFCRMCEKSGVLLYVDTGLILQHETEVMLPIPTAQMVDCLKEEWRQPELNQIGGLQN